MSGIKVTPIDLVLMFYSRFLAFLPILYVGLLFLAKMQNISLCIFSRHWWLNC